MAETTIADTLKTATDAVQERVESLKDSARYQIRKGVPKAERALKAGYQDAADAVRATAGNRSVQVGIAVGLLGLAAGLLLSRR